MLSSIEKQRKDQVMFAEMIRKGLLYRTLECWVRKNDDGDYEVTQPLEFKKNTYEPVYESPICPFSYKC